MKLRIRKTWGNLRPTERVHERAGRRSGYCRKDEKRELGKTLCEIFAEEERELDKSLEV